MINDQTENFITVKDIIKAIINEKYLVFTITSTFAILSVIYSLSLPNIYRSEILLAPVDEQESLSGISQNFGGLASLAGVTIPSSSLSRSNEGIEILQSLYLFQELIKSNNILPDLLAVKEWDSKKNEIIYDETIYDSTKKKWIRRVQHPYTSIPSDQEAFRQFKEIFSVEKDPKTGFIKMSILHQSPYVSQKWLSNMILLLNEDFRARDKSSALKSIEFLNSRIATTNLSEIKLALSELIQNQTQTLMLIESNEEYVFKVLDPAFVPERKILPNRSLICIVGSIFGFIMSLLVIFTKAYFRKEKFL